ncbi:MAG: iron-containing alcohol dehydrogenase [Candidatus Thermoplasmatota archaeon]|nr:iron-containing alcohol dehydrogenase [Candidatus Thermoplasmatota archaeon]
MLNFTYHVPTRVVFGKGSLDKLGRELSCLGDSLLFVYGQGSIKKTGLYDAVHQILKKQQQVRYRELAGVQPNPRITSVRDGIALCKEHGVTGILAVGGGSVLDCAKTIATGVFYPDDPWEMFLKGDSTIQRALPVGAVMTFAGTGSEMNGNAVISNEQTSQKLAIHSDLLRPAFSLLDPTYTITVPRDQTAAGVVDIFSHILEQYFSPTQETFVQDRLAESLLNTIVHYGPVTLNEPHQYEARAQVMWTSSLALNGLLGYGKLSDWATHAIEHVLSAFYDVTHGVGLAILTPAWMQYVCEPKTRERFVTYAQNVWGITGTDADHVATQGILKTQEFFTSLGMPTRLRDIGIHNERLQEAAKSAVAFGDIGKFKKLGYRDVLTILQNAY